METFYGSLILCYHLVFVEVDINNNLLKVVGTLCR